MANLIVSPEAKVAIDEIVESVSEFTGFLASGEKLFNELIKTFELIAFIPNGAGRLREDGCRETFCRGYRIVYDVIDDSVYIITVIHSRRLYPRP